jgi:hypothetical protein
MSCAPQKEKIPARKKISHRPLKKHLLARKKTRQQKIFY